ncbi:MAG: hypothetical protein JJU11_13355 [Candidatus Sumerlaeia bacterium]|nr:hypothetical protein [Candidatus Sumerlaeia bacterium]
MLQVRFRSQGFVYDYENVSIELTTNADNPGGDLVTIPLQGSVVDTLGGQALGILDDYSDGLGLSYLFDMEPQFSVGEDPFYGTTQLVAITNTLTTPNHSYASTDLSVAVPGWELNSALENMWMGWMRLARPSPGWGETQYGVGAVLAADRPDFNHPSAQGYALLYRGGSVGEMAISLVRFTSGIREGTTELPAGCVEIAAAVLDPGTDGWNYRIHLHDTGIWEVRLVSGSPLPEAAALDPNNYTGGVAVSAAPETTFTGKDYKYGGWVWAHGGSDNILSRAFYGNLGAGISGVEDTSPLEVVSITAMEPASGISTGENITWEIAFNKEIVPGSIYAEDLELVATEGDLAGAEIVDIVYTDFDVIHVEASVGSGDKTLALWIPEEARFEDRFGNVYTDDITGIETFLVDQTVPQVSLGTPSHSITSAGPVDFPVNYTDADVVTLDSSSVEVITTNTAVGSVSVSGSGVEERVVTLNDLSGDGEVAIRILSGTAASPGGNLAGPSTLSAPVIVDNTAPEVDSITPNPAIPLAALSTISVTFSEPVTLPGPGVLTVEGSMATTVSGNGPGPYVFSGWSVPEDGPVEVALAGGGIVDPAGNSMVSTQLSYTIDSSAVGASITSATVAADGATSLTAISLTITFTEDVAGMSTSLFGGSGYSMTSLEGSGDVYTATVVATDEGLITVELPASAVTATDPPNNGNSPASFTFMHDATPPLVHAEVNAPSSFQEDIVVSYTAEDTLSGIEVVTLKVWTPTATGYLAVDTSMETEDSFVYTPEEPGLHRFLVVARDAAGNLSEGTPEDALAVSVGMEENGPLALEIPEGSNVEVTFPLGPDVGVTLAFDTVTSASVLSVERLFGAGQTTDFALDPDHLAGQYFRILDLGNLVFGQATITFTMTEADFGSGVANLAALTTVYTIRNGTLTTHPLTPDGNGGLETSGITEFSDWHPGAGNLGVTDWSALDEE